jgi:hypothetical protein
MGDMLDGQVQAGRDRGERIHQFAISEFAEHYDDAYDARMEVLREVAHAALAQVGREGSAEAIGRLLGTVAADLAVERALEAGGPASDQEIWAVKIALEKAVDTRHWG